MGIISAYREVGSYRGAAALCGTTHKTVRRVIEAHQASRGELPAARVGRGRNYDSVTQLVAEKVNETAGRISAKRLLPAAPPSSGSSSRSTCSPQPPLTASTRRPAAS